MCVCVCVCVGVMGWGGGCVYTDTSPERDLVTQRVLCGLRERGCLQEKKEESVCDCLCGEVGWSVCVYTDPSPERLLLPGLYVCVCVCMCACAQTCHQKEPPVTWAANTTCVVIPEGPHHAFLGLSPGLFSGLQLPVTLVSPTSFEKKVKKDAAGWRVSLRLRDLFPDLCPGVRLFCTYTWLSRHPPPTFSFFLWGSSLWFGEPVHLLGSSQKQRCFWPRGFARL